MQDISQNRAFAHLLDQLAALYEGASGTVTAGHHDLGPDLWLSADPAGRTTMSYQSSEHGFRLSVEAGDTGAWACLGMRLPIETLRRGRYLGLLVVAESEKLISFTPTLRYFSRDRGIQDNATPAPVILAGGQREHLAHIPLDLQRLQAASGCELNLFFSNDAFAANILKIEPLLIQ